MGQTCDAIYTGIVNKTTNTPNCASKTYVKPSSASGSLVWLKADPNAVQACGGKMPLGSSGVSQADADMLKAWIDGGALK